MGAHLSEVVRARVDHELYAALERQAQSEGRDLSQLVRNLLRSAMIDAGQLQAAQQ